MANEKSWQSGKPLMKCINTMLQHQVATDVTFVVEDCEIKAHKFILISRSPSFEAMFSGRLPEPNEIKIMDVSKKTFNMFLRYLYTDNIAIDIDNVADILKVADKYLVDILTEKCHAYVKEHLNPDNVCLMKERCHAFPNEKLLSECRRIEEEAACAILESTGFTELCKDCVKEMISSDCLPVDEHFVFEAVIRWAEEECRMKGVELTDENRRKYSYDLFDHIRFPIMNVGYFCKTLFNMSVLSDSELVKLHRYIHKQESWKQTRSTPGQADQGVCDTIKHPIVGRSTQSTDESCSQRFQSMNNTGEVSQVTDATDDLSACLCGFKCTERVRYRKGKYTVVCRQLPAKSRYSSVLGTSTQIVAVSEHFRCSSPIYLHGITTVFSGDHISVKVNDEDVRIELADGNLKTVKFRKIIQIYPESDNVIYLMVGNEEKNLLRNTLSNTITFDGVTIKFTDSGNNSIGYVTGLLLSK